jgi:cytochrome c oxidase assembly protein subunit 15
VQRALAIAAVVAQGGIAVTGSVVRVTGSGLGCPTWPECAPGSMIPVAQPALGQLHQWVEYGNRLLAGVISVVAVACLLAALLAKPRRRRVVWLALTMPLGVLVQAVVGGITVRMALTWWTVMPHFLISPVLVWLAMLLVRAIGEGEQAPRSLVPGPLRWLQAATVVVLAALQVAGTLVTAAGPHAGDVHTPRLRIAVPTLAQLHADLLILFLGMLIALGFALWAAQAPTSVRRRYGVLVGVVVAQGTLGAVQYATGVPEVLVSLHVLGAVLVTIAAAALWTATRDRGPADATVTAGTATHNVEKIDAPMPV